MSSVSQRYLKSPLTWFESWKDFLQFAMSLGCGRICMEGTLVVSGWWMWRTLAKAGSVYIRFTVSFQKIWRLEGRISRRMVDVPAPWGKLLWILLLCYHQIAWGEVVSTLGNRWWTSPLSKQSATRRRFHFNCDQLTETVLHSISFVFQCAAISWLFSLRNTILTFIRRSTPTPTRYTRQWR